MKTFASILCISIFASFRIMSQTVAFEKGQIITKSNDTIRALVELTPTYDIVVSYKMNTDAPIQKMKINNIKSLATPYNFYQNVALNKKELLFRLVVNGNTTLLEYSKINISTTYDAYGGTMTKYGPPTVIYVIKTTENEYVIYKKKDTDIILPLLGNCKNALELVNSKTFKLEDLEKVVTALNKCN